MTCVVSGIVWTSLSTSDNQPGKLGEYGKLLGLLIIELLGVLVVEGNSIALGVQVEEYHSYK